LSESETEGHGQYCGPELLCFHQRLIFSSTWERGVLRLLRVLPASDSRHLLAAPGWVELGNNVEANEELEKNFPHFLRDLSSCPSI
jgi:hypothetical protein